MELERVQSVVDSLAVGRSDVILVKTRAGTARRNAGPSSTPVIAEVVGMLKALSSSDRVTTQLRFVDSLDRWVHTRAAPGVLLVWVFGRDRDPEIVRLFAAQAMEKLGTMAESAPRRAEPGDGGPEGAPSHAYAGSAAAKDRGVA